MSLLKCSLKQAFRSCRKSRAPRLLQKVKLEPSWRCINTSSCKTVNSKSKNTTSARSVSSKWMRKASYITSELIEIWPVLSTKNLRIWPWTTREIGARNYRGWQIRFKEKVSSHCIPNYCRSCLIRKLSFQHTSGSRDKTPACWEMTWRSSRSNISESAMKGSWVSQLST